MKDLLLSCPIRSMPTYGGGFLTHLMYKIRSARGDIGEQFCLEKRLERTAYLIWFLINVDKEFPLLASDTPPLSWSDLDHTCPEYGGRNPLTIFEAAFWLGMPVPKDCLNLDEADDRLAIKSLVAIWKKPFSHMPRSSFSEAEITELAEPEPSLENDLPIPINRAMYAIWKVRRDLQTSFPLDCRESRASYVIWFCSHGRAEFDLSPLGISAITSEIAEERDHSSGENVSRFMHLTWLSNQELRHSYDLQSQEGVEAFTKWFESTNRFVCVTVEDQENIQESTESSVVYQLSNNCLLSPESIPRKIRTHGVNIFGAARGGFGMGRHTQMTALAAHAAGVPCCVVDKHVDYGTQPMDQTPVSELISPDGEYRTNLVCENAYGFPRALGYLGREQFDSYYNIYFGNWEYKSLPDSWSSIVQLFDEAWAPSWFSYDCLKKSTDIPIHYVPLAVSIERGIPKTRQDFDLPSDSFLFLQIFDFYSNVDRKNPRACIEAFQKAFPPGERAEQRVGLIVKVKSVNDSVMEEFEQWREIKAMAIEDDRIRFIEKDYKHYDIVELIALCDAFISLHRAEGFGFSMAEAMLLGKPVIATNYSGNTDFTKMDNSCPVGFELVPVSIEKQLGMPAVWAEPDIEHAAWYMRRLVANSTLAGRLGEAGRAYISEHYNPLTVGRRIKDRLDEIESSLEASHVTAL